jgi:ribose-phosphate pyrophosphokinase
MALFFPMPGNEDLAHELAVHTASGTGRIESRHFPDGETYVRVHGDAKDQEAFAVCTLAHPDEQFLPLVFAARVIRATGAKSVTLVAPYLSYLRQDRAFTEGEAVSSRIFADLIGREFDRLVTIDPHLHRYASLDEVYDIPATVVHAGALIAAWVRNNVSAPVVLGPDEESVQWVEEIAREADCPWAVFRKERRGDREVQLTAPELDSYRNRTPVLVDDVISSGTTMKEAAKLLLAAGLQPPHCVAVHGLLTEETAAELRRLTQSLLTTDSVRNTHGKLKVAPLLAEHLAIASV